MFLVFYKFFLLKLQRSDIEKWSQGKMLNLTVDVAQSLWHTNINIIFQLHINNQAGVIETDTYFFCRK